MGSNTPTHPSQSRRLLRTAPMPIAEQNGASQTILRNISDWVDLCAHCADQKDFLATYNDLNILPFNRNDKSEKGAQG